MNLKQITKFCKFHFGNTGWIAVDEDLEVIWYRLEPKLFEADLQWNSFDELRVVCTKYTGDKDWKDTLTSIETKSCSSCHHNYSWIGADVGDYNYCSECPLNSYKNWKAKERRNE